MIRTDTHIFAKPAPRRVYGAPAFGDFLDAAPTWPAVKPRGWQYAIKPGALEMLGNDRYGCCAEAGAGHHIQSTTANTDEPLHMTLKQCLDLYSELTGFNPGKPWTDQGTVLADLLRYWREIGIKVTNAAGQVVVHKIKGWATLDLGSVAQMRYANDVFGGTYLGINCPKSADLDTSNWKWDPKSPSVGGHCINGEGQGSAGGHVQSWGLNIPFTWEFMLHTLDEGYVVVSDFWVNRQKVSPAGLDLDATLAAMAKM